MGQQRSRTVLEGGPAASIYRMQTASTRAFATVANSMTRHTNRRVCVWLDQSDTPGGVI